MATTTISNCKFGYQCDKSWDELKEISAPKIRHCERCDQPILFCETPEELMNAIREGHCCSRL